MLDAFEIFSYILALIYAGIWVPEFFTATENKIEKWSFITISTLSGMLTVYLTFLAIGDFQKVFFACHIIGTISAIWMIYKAWKGKLQPFKIPWNPWQWSLVGLALIILFAIAFTGISDWQARSVWYFQAKILHHTGNFDAPDWHNPHYAFAFAAHPKLYPVIIAFVTSSWDQWNEYAPKWTLFLFLLPVVTSLFSMRLNPLTMLLIFLALLGIPGEVLWNGSPEAYAAAFFGLGLLNFAYYQKTNERTHLLQALLFMGILPSFNPDGLALLTCFALSLSFFNPSAVSVITERNVSKFLLIPIAAFVFWQLRKLEFRFADSLIISESTVDRMITRLVEIKPFLQIIRNTLKVHLDLLVFLGLVAIYFRIPKVRSTWQVDWIRPDLRWIWITSGLYLIFLFLIYWASPNDIQWYAVAHLKSAALSVKYALVIFVALSLEPTKQIVTSSASAKH